MVVGYSEELKERNHAREAMLYAPSQWINECPTFLAELWGDDRERTRVTALRHIG